jgi:hypothetical protein
MFSKATIAAMTITLFVIAAPASAQLIQSTGNSNIQGSWNTAKNSTMALRAPGLLVTKARTAFSDAHRKAIAQSRFGPTITEQEPALTQEQQVRIDVINTLFTNLNTALQAYNAFLRANAGLPPSPGDNTTSAIFDLLGSINSPSS